MADAPMTASGLPSPTDGTPSSAAADAAAAPPVESPGSRGSTRTPPALPSWAVSDPAARDAIERLALTLQRIRDAVASRIVGQDEVIEETLVAFIARGHILLEGVPGTAKTLLVRTLAEVLGARFGRIQFTPDLMPSDITGVSVLQATTREFEFHPGPVFTDLLLADEINRAPAKTQAALLEAMQERQVTTDGVGRSLGELFTVLATQNPVEYEGTYPAARGAARSVPPQGQSRLSDPLVRARDPLATGGGLRSRPTRAAPDRAIAGRRGVPCAASGGRHGESRTRSTGVRDGHRARDARRHGPDTWRLTTRQRDALSRGARRGAPGRPRLRDARRREGLRARRAAAPRRGGARARGRGSECGRRIAGHPVARPRPAVTVCVSRRPW